MKTTLDLPDALFEQAKAHARAQGTSLKALFENGLRMALHAQPAKENKSEWPDLSFHPAPEQSGVLIAPEHWRDIANASAVLDRTS